VLRRSAVLALVALALLGCSKKPKTPPPPKPVTGTEVAGFIEQQLSGKFPGLTVGHATCPTTLKLEQDKPEFCQIPVEGQPVRVRVTRATNGLYTVANDQAVIPVATLEDNMRADASQKAGVPLLIDCGDRAVLIFDPPKTVQCLGSAPGRSTITYDVTISDAQGNFSYAEHKEQGG
jgi:hypothetical protein